MEVSPYRLGIIRAIVALALGSLLGRLFVMQVLHGPAYRSVARSTAVRFVLDEAPRGRILDRRGEVLADTKLELAVVLDVTHLSRRQRDVVERRLAALLRLEPSEVRRRAADDRGARFLPRPIAYGVSRDQAIALAEHMAELPGTYVLEVPRRTYPNGSLAAHVLGFVGEIDAKELARFGRHDPSRYAAGEHIGKAGVEQAYDTYLRGRPALRKVLVDVFGNQVGSIDRTYAEPGSDVVLTLDGRLQRAAERALDGALFEASGRGGAVVALDPRTGEVLALASRPSFDPNAFSDGISASELARLEAPQAGAPLLDRALAEQIPSGSTFKPITAAAAWSAGLVSPDLTIEDPGYAVVGARVFHSSSGALGAVDLRRSLVASSDTYYYRLGVALNEARQRLGERLQAVARSFGFGSPAGIDIAGEEPGLVPDAAWKRTHDPVDPRWYAGDSANLAIGQGSLEVTPLQLAVAYAAIANRGAVPRPHVVLCIRNPARATPSDPCAGGAVPASARPRVVRRASAPADALDFIARALAGVVHPGGTAGSAFAGFPFDRLEVAGKTGTAETPGARPYSWFAAFAPVDHPQIVVVAMIEGGGFGAQAAAPAARQVLEAFAQGP